MRRERDRRSRSSTGRTATSRSTAQYTGNAAADFLLGLPAQFRAGHRRPRPSRTATAGCTPVYAQDEWRVGRALTLNAGLRYELHQPFVDDNEVI